jgi:hypothetical protein
MKNLVYLLMLSVVLITACKKEPVVNSLIPGIDPNVKLPAHDTTGASAYIEGYIDGERFCLVHNKDSVKWIDYASALFCCDFQKEWVNGIGGRWYFQQPEIWNKNWKIEFVLPTFGTHQSVNDYSFFRKKYSSVGTFNNITGTFKTKEDLDKFKLFIWRTDSFNGEQNTLGVGTIGDIAPGVSVDQTGSFIKLVSITKMDPVKSGGYNYQLIYEFDLKLVSGNKVLHLTKGRMKTWIENLKL